MSIRSSIFIAALAVDIGISVAARADVPVMDVNQAESSTHMLQEMRKMRGTLAQILQIQTQQFALQAKQYAGQAHPAACH